MNDLLQATSFSIKNDAKDVATFTKTNLFSHINWDQNKYNLQLGDNNIGADLINVSFVLDELNSNLDDESINIVTKLKITLNNLTFISNNSRAFLIKGWESVQKTIDTAAYILDNGNKERWVTDLNNIEIQMQITNGRKLLDNYSFSDRTSSDSTGKTEFNITGTRNGIIAKSKKEIAGFWTGKQAADELFNQTQISASPKVTSQTHINEFFRKNLTNLLSVGWDNNNKYGLSWFTSDVNVKRYIKILWKIEALPDRGKVKISYQFNFKINSSSAYTTNSKTIEISNLQTKQTYEWLQYFLRENIGSELKIWKPTKTYDPMPDGRWECARKILRRQWDWTVSDYWNYDGMSDLLYPYEGIPGDVSWQVTDRFFQPYDGSLFFNPVTWIESMLKQYGFLKSGQKIKRMYIYIFKYEMLHQ